MPNDPRRNQGPENCINYRLFSDSGFKYDEYLKSVKKTGLRGDGRKLSDHRKIYMKTGIVTQAKGSAYVEYDKTKVIVSVYDPREIPRLSEFAPLGDIFCEFKYAPFSCREKRGHVMDAEEKDLSGIIKRALEPAVCRHEFPNFQVDVYVMVLENDGCTLAASITAAGLALTDASIPMYDIITATAVGVHGNDIFIDPTFDEETLCKTTPLGTNLGFGLITISYMGKDEQISDISEIGALKVSQISNSIDICIKKCEAVAVLAKQCLLENLKKKLAQNKE